jgi:hypothetical protein
VEPTQPPVHRYQVSFLGLKQPECSDDHPTPFSTEVKERVELYLYFLPGTSWPALG